MPLTQLASLALIFRPRFSSDDADRLETRTFRAASIARHFDHNGCLITPDHMAAEGAGVTQGKRGEVALFCLHFHVFRFHGSKPRRQQQNVGNDLNDPFAFRNCSLTVTPCAPVVFD